MGKHNNIETFIIECNEIEDVVKKSGNITLLCNCSYGFVAEPIGRCFNPYEHKEESSVRIGSISYF